MKLPYDSAIASLDFYPRKRKDFFSLKYLQKQRFIIALFIVAKNCNQLIYPPTDIIKQIVGHTCLGILLINKEEWMINKSNKLDRSLGNYAEWKKSQSQKG